LTVAAFNVLTIGGCAPPPPAGGCPPLVTYSPAFQKRLAAEMRAMPKGSAAAEVIIDTSKMRDACRDQG
jgi:hypothetical protein